MLGRHVLTGLNKYGEKFPIHTEELINELIEKFSLDKTQMDKSVDSLNFFDDYLLNNTQLIDQNFVDANLLGLIAYMGEVCILNKGGRWKMCLDQDKQTWIPMIEDINGRYQEDFIGHIYSTLAEDEYPYIRGCYIFR